MKTLITEQIPVADENFEQTTGCSSQCVKSNILIGESLITFNELGLASLFPAD